MAIYFIMRDCHRANASYDGGREVVITSERSKRGNLPFLTYKSPPTPLYQRGGYNKDISPFIKTISYISPLEKGGLRGISLSCHPETNNNKCHPETNNNKCHPETNNNKCHPELVSGSHLSSPRDKGEGRVRVIHQA